MNPFQVSMEHPQIPLTCYRLQFNRDLTFQKASEILEYLSRLGITDIYASPLLQSYTGSQHGYDGSQQPKPPRIIEEKLHFTHSRVLRAD